MSEQKKVLVKEKLAPEGVKYLEDLGFQVATPQEAREALERLREGNRRFVAKERRARIGVGQIRALQREARVRRERTRARLLERDVVVRLEIVDADDVERMAAVVADDAFEAGGEVVGSIEGGDHDRCRARRTRRRRSAPRCPGPRCGAARPCLRRRRAARP